MQQQRAPGSCAKTEIYVRQRPERTASEARLLVLAAFAENELPTAVQDEIDAHLKECRDCVRIFKELTAEEPVQIVVARCPSSESLDAFIFSRNTLSSNHASQIEAHLRDCPLCREECEWLRSVDGELNIQPVAMPTRTPMGPILAMAALLAIAFGAFLFWQNQYPVLPHDQLQSLAVIKDPSEIDFAELQNTSSKLESSLLSVYESGVQLFKQGKYYEASRLFQKVQNQSPEHSAAVFLLGYSYYKMNQPEKAFALCHSAEDMRPHAYERCMFLVHLALKTGHYDRALSEITALYHEVPEDPEIRRMYDQITTLMKT